MTKKKWIYIVFLFTLLRGTVQAQTSLFGLSENQLGGGVEIRGHSVVPLRVLMGNLGMGFNDGTLRISVLGGLPMGDSESFIEESNLPVEDTGISESIFGLEAVHRAALASDFEFFSMAEFSIILDGWYYPTVLVGAFGLSKHIKTQEGGVKPFVGLAYQRLTLDHGQDPVWFYGAKAGLEYRMPRFSISALVRSVFPLDSSQFGFKLGINFFL